jgi:alpha-glucosidase (family GH31 glycosyl hydrolase)
MNRYNRRHILKTMGAASAALLLPYSGAAAEAISDLEVQVAPVSPHTVRLSVLPIQNNQPAPVPLDGSLIQSSWGDPVLKVRGREPAREVRCGELQVAVSADPLAFTITTAHGDPVQKIRIEENGLVVFELRNSPLLGLGEGGAQFDRRGFADTGRNGQGAYKLRTHGARVAIPWLIGASGWAMFVHRPHGTFDLTGSEGRFIPENLKQALPLDLFVVASKDPAVIMAEYARLTGHPEMPPLWCLGYQQSHRTLASREEILAEAKTFREKELPCDALIYLGTGFCPSGWNTANGSFSWNSRVFPDPKKMLEELHQDHFKVALHDVILTDDLRGRASDACNSARFDEEEASCLWDMHRKDFALGVDGWWPDEGDALGIKARLVRNRMYWDGPQMDRPNERPYSLHRNGYAGMQRYAPFLWSGDVYSTWEALQTQIPIGINTGLTGIPYWGTDIGGFVPTKEFTAELFVRWFQFGAFCTLFRSHGRTWKLHLPWGWNTGETGPTELTGFSDTATPDPSQLRNPQVEVICRKYLELRYRMLPYLYSAVRECVLTGMPVMRALWLHHSDDPQAVARGDEYLWGRDLLVAPVVEPGATARRVYLPRGTWYDFWTGERVDGGREISRAVDLETIPLYVRAGAVIPMGPVKQYVEEKVDGPLSVSIYPGADGLFLLYEDDGRSFKYRNGDWTGLQMRWDDSRRIFSVRHAGGSRHPERRTMEVKLQDTTRSIEFAGLPLAIKF